ncbi:MAG: hypothetical protein IJ315_05360 [Firmicutes bacterium]|nr:hypothetical protein [Bacillota bacterium]
MYVSHIYIWDNTLQKGEKSVGKWGAGRAIYADRTVFIRKNADSIRLAEKAEPIVPIYIIQGTLQGISGKGSGADILDDYDMQRSITIGPEG